jgi:hypothetical protein
MDWLDDRAAFHASQRRAQTLARDWRRSAAYRGVAAQFAGLATGDAVAVAAAAERLFATTDWLEALLAPLIDALAADDAFEPPLRVARDLLRTGAIVYDDARVTIAATVMSATALATQPAPLTLVVPGRMSVVRYVKAGGARLRHWYAGPVAADFETLPPAVACDDRMLADGMVVRHDGRVDGHMVADATGDMVTLTATIRDDAAPYMREYAIDGGALVRAAPLDDDASRTQMLLTLLRLSRRADAGDLFEAATRDATFALRWAAMREWLALDVARALPRLRAMAAGDPHIAVRDAARQTLALVETKVAA